MATVISEGCVITTVRVAVQVLWSVTWSTNVPAGKDDRFGEVLPPGLQLYEYGAVPPVTVVEMAAVEALKQATLVCDSEIVIDEGCVIVTSEVVVHALLSVTLTLYVPAGLPVTAVPVCEMGIQLYV